MSIDAIRRAATAALSNNRITRDEVRSLFNAARTSGSTVDAGERAELQRLLTTHASKFSAAARTEFSRLIGSPAPQPPPPPPGPTPTPAQPERTTIEARKPWSTTYWPMAGSGNSDGSASSNLWAKDGPMAKFDALLKARGQAEGARAFELKPALNWLVGKETGHYVPNSMLSEKDAERTTGVDFNNNGKIDADVAWDFLDSRGQFGKDGKTEGTMSVGWWGSCDKVALAGVLFEEPKKDVTLNGVTFTRQDIKGLLTVIADGQAGGFDFKGDRFDNTPDLIRLRNGQELRGTISTPIDFKADGARRQQDWQINANQLPDEVKVKLMDGTERTLKKSELSFVAREDKRDDPVLMHETIGEWLKSGRPAVMDKDSGDHVWNYNFYKADDTTYRDGLKPSWATDELLKDGFKGPAGDGKIVWVERQVTFMGSGNETYRYWLEEKNGKFVNGGWAPGSNNPDFLWRPAGTPTFTGRNERNPFVDPTVVKAIYEASIAP
ncbi:MAG: hypothetical protein INH41_23995 [Myxococcaceae bacterium]|nr:hypothetical protein [Myxococcaceae bacterium]MCA3015463.1 hypothetical protein [Myxococcaceae bacterium]